MGKKQLEIKICPGRLTATGVRCLLETFMDLQLPMHVLKLHHNRIAEGGGWAKGIRRCEVV